MGLQDKLEQGAMLNRVLAMENLSMPEDPEGALKEYLDALRQSAVDELMLEPETMRALINTAKSYATTYGIELDEGTLTEIGTKFYRRRFKGSLYNAECEAAAGSIPKTERYLDDAVEEFLYIGCMNLSQDDIRYIEKIRKDAERNLRDPTVRRRQIDSSLASARRCSGPEIACSLPTKLGLDAASYYASFVDYQLPEEEMSEILRRAYTNEMEKFLQLAELKDKQGWSPKKRYEYAQYCFDMARKAAYEIGTNIEDRIGYIESSILRR